MKTKKSTHRFTAERQYTNRDASQLRGESPEIFRHGQLSFTPTPLGGQGKKTFGQFFGNPLKRQEK
jgi:hypothetical protein